MSLRVLLADRSTSIEKVFRMGLEDFGAEVKTIHNGLDVLKTTEDYQPHIIFIDILLQKKNGYEVTRELGQNKKTKHIPVVLMWSPFMELDQKEYQSCGAKAELEKPFEIEVMRQIFNSLVKNSESRNISDFLDFPEEIEPDSDREKELQKTDDEADKYNFFSISDQQNQEEGEKQPPVDKESLFAESLEKFKPGQQLDDKSHSFFNMETEEEFEPLKTDNKKEEKYDFSFTEFSTATDSQEEEEEEEKEENVKSPLFSFTETEEKTPPSRHQKTESSEKQNTQASNKSMIENIKTEKTGSNQSADLQIDQKLKLEDFLYQPDSDKTPQQKIHTQPSPIKLTPDNQNLSSIPPEIRSFLEKTIRDQLPSIVEKVVREELEKIFKQEMELKKSNNR